MFAEVETPREAVLLGGLLDREEDLELAGSEPVLIGWAVWELGNIVLWLICAHGIRVGQIWEFVEHLFAFVSGSVYSFISYRCSNPLEHR